MKPSNSNPETPLILWLDQLRLEDLPRVGGKNAALGELFHAAGNGPGSFAVPQGFALTTRAFELFVSENRLQNGIDSLLAPLSECPPHEWLGRLERAGAELRAALMAAPLPEPILQAVDGALRTLESMGRSGSAPASGGNAGTVQRDPAEPQDVAVRSSATAEDLPEASFAGAQASFLHVQGTEAVLDCVRRCYASLYNDRAISYRADRGFPLGGSPLSVGIQRMVRAGSGASGVAFTLDPESGFRGVVSLSATLGLGEALVQGAVTPDEYLVSKIALAGGRHALLRRVVARKQTRMVPGGTDGTLRSEPVLGPEGAAPTLGDEEVLRLARWACRVEEHFSEKLGRPTPMDLEWAKDGPTGELFLLQARPETVHSRKPRGILERHRLAPGETGVVRVTGCAVGTGIASGRVRVIREVSQMDSLQPGEVLVTERTDPDWQPAMRRAAAVVTDRGGRTCHAAIVGRELGIPAVVGTGNGTTLLETGQDVTVSCAEGDQGRVYGKTLRWEVDRFDLRTLPRPRTELFLNLAQPSQAMGLSFLPCAGVGLARMEFLIGEVIGIHPLALTRFDEIRDPETRDRIRALTAGYPDKPGYFIEELARGIGLIAAAFHPRPVILRLSDFKTNEYAHLLGGRQFEPEEENPMLGFRGACRYPHPRYREGFALECRAVRRVREEMGFGNLHLMVPFCRTPAEAEAVVAELEGHGLRRGSLRLYMMCEVPSNVILADAFAPHFDGFSIGSNDLTQLVLGVDRDNEILAASFDERDPAVKAFIAQAVAACKRNRLHSGICGQAPSDFPEFAAFLVREGIDSISLNADSFLNTLRSVLDAEGALEPESGPGPSQPGANPAANPATPRPETWPET
jgi:pyruvate,water dikinase